VVHRHQWYTGATGASGTQAPVVHRRQCFTGASDTHVRVVHGHEFWTQQQATSDSLPTGSGSDISASEYPLHMFFSVCGMLTAER